MQRALRAIPNSSGGTPSTLRALVGLGGDDGHVVQPVMLGVLDHLDLGIGDDEREGLGRLVEIGLAFLALLLLPPHLDDADLGQQRILDEAVEDQEARIAPA